MKVHPVVSLGASVNLSVEFGHSVVLTSLLCTSFKPSWTFLTVEP